MTSSDPVVRDFFLSHNFAEISGPWRPGSIRDQIVRARMVIERAVASRWISHERPLAVLGAGIAGISAALIARANNVGVTIFEKDKPASVQSRSFRWIDPAAYDWPHQWWGSAEAALHHRGRWPPTLNAGTAHTIAFQFASLLKQQKEIRYIREEITGFYPNENRVRVTTAAGLCGEFALVFDCRGAGQERSCADFKVIPFWSGHDPRKIVAGLAAKLGRPPRVVISGGGDGAIQDFLLLATGRASITELAQHAGIARAVSRTGLPPISASIPELAAFEREALSLEERYWREFCWCAPSDDSAESRLAPSLAKFYEGWVNRLWPTLDSLPTSLTPVDLTLVRKAPHHSVCYPLNRLLAIVAERQFKPKLVTGPLERLYKPSDFDLALVRHGIGTATARVTVRKQLLPFG